MEKQRQLFTSQFLRFTLLTALCTLFTVHFSLAQSWQWAKRGGGTTSPQNIYETVRDMATDRNGNIYVLANVYGPIDIDGHTHPGYGYEDISISSWSCNGSFRWKKIIGGVSDDDGKAIKVDTLGGVYVTGFFDTHYGVNGVHVDADTFITSTLRTMFLVKYDTAGNYKWMRMPQPDTVSLFTSFSSQTIDMDVAPNGDAHLFCRLTPGAYANGTLTVSPNGEPRQLYMLKYNGAGNFLGGTALDMRYRNAGIGQMRMKRDHRNGRYYFSGLQDPIYNQDTLYMGNMTIDHAMFAACYNSQGNMVWAKQNTTNGQNTGFQGCSDIDGQGNIYMGGRILPGEVFNGYTFTSTSIDEMAFILKLDSNGNNIWVKKSTSAGSSHGVAVSKSGNTVALTGYPHMIAFDQYSTLGGQGNGGKTYLARFDVQTGACVGLDTLNSGAETIPNAIIADNKGNYYVGGEFRTFVTAGASTVYNIGNYSDFFIAKYGQANCNCVTPQAAFSKVSSQASVMFTYSGTTGYDSLRWEFGDGTTSTQANPTHTYAGSGTYNACVTVYNSCGQNQICQTVIINLGVANLSALGDIRVYPNPASGFFMVDADRAYKATLFNTIGQQVLQQSLTAGSNTIATSNLPSGTYMLQLVDERGQRGMAVIVVEK